MKTVLQYTMTTGAGAGTYAATNVSVNGKTKSQATYVADKNYGITKVQIMGANGSYITVARDGHPGDDLNLIQQADALTDAQKMIDIYELFNQKGITLDKGEGLSMTIAVTANATIDVFIELDDSVSRVNGKAVRVLGSNAAVANTPVETGALVPGGFAPSDVYRGRACYFTSTTIQNMSIGLNNKGLCVQPGQNAILTGQGYTKLDNKQAELMTGTGQEYSATFEAWINATAADAANVQILGMIFEKN